MALKLGMCGPYQETPIWAYSECLYQNRNSAKIGGYFPLIGIGIGSVRIYRAIKRHNENFYNTRDMMVRGSIEILGLGILFLPVDVYLMHKRKRKWKKLNGIAN